MHITKVQLQNFKRFTDLTIDFSGLEKLPKLVLLVGPNGSGKSSIFDAFSVASPGSNSNIRQHGDLFYYMKKKPRLISGKWRDPEDKTDFAVEIFFDDNEYTAKASSKERTGAGVHKFYGRTSLRQLPRLSRNRTTANYNVSFISDEDKPEYFIDYDFRLENDLDYLTSVIVRDTFETKKTHAEIFSAYVEPINKAFERIFEDDYSNALQLDAFYPPLQDNPINVFFRKGELEIRYDYLSAGEKEVFNIIVNLFHRRQYFKQTIYFIDELDLHLNTSLQKKFIEELVTNWIPDGCQLWTASHSLGFIEYANESENSAIIDFANLDFDIPQVLIPKPKDSTEIFEIAVPKDSLSILLAGKSIFFAENTDTKYYNGLGIDATIFIDANNRDDVFYKVKSKQYDGIIDRDFLLDEERTEIMQIHTRLKILEFYSIENYLYHPDNLQEYFSNGPKVFDKSQYIQNITEAKNNELAALIYRIQGSRNSYPFFKETSKQERRKKFDKAGEDVVTLLQQNKFIEFYSLFPMKDYGTIIPERQNIDKLKLAQTTWFKTQIQKIIK